MAQTKPKAGQFYGVSDNGTDGEFLQTDGTGGMAWASPITNPTITSIDYPGTATAANPAGGESVIINGTLFASGITCTVGGTTATTVFNSATQITINTPAKSAGAYAVAVTNSNGGTASQANFIQYSGIPIWTTAAGNIGSVLEGAAASFQVTATEGSDTIEYAVTTGTLPTGLSLATATGAITGTAGSVSADTTTTFSITATDDENQTSAVRSFNIIVQNDAPSNHFAPYIYTGNGSTQNIPLNFKPDLVWIKLSGQTRDHMLFDSVRGPSPNRNIIYPNRNYIQSTGAAEYLSTFNNNGFTVGNSNYTGASGVDYVSWNFKAGGAAVDNTDGTITSKVSVNNTLGFSIVEYETSGVQSIGHGLDAAPSMVIQKLYSASSRWTVYTATAGLGKYLQLDQADALTSDAYFFSAINDSTFTTAWSGTNYKYINYCFTSKPGFSKVGSYTGNGSTNGPMVNTGFEPAFVMVKGSSNSGSWLIYDNKRTSNNPRNKQLRADSDIGQTTSSNLSIDFFTNGFQLKGSDTDYNGSGRTFIYLSMAADGTTSTPTLANSFATELYNGNSSNQSITTGFKPGFVWMKGRNYADASGLFDSVRGTNFYLASSETAAQGGQASYNTLTSFDNNGFTLGNDVTERINLSGKTYVSWSWKAGILDTIDTNGTITSLVSANQAAGFSVVKWTTSTSLATVGHGLGAPAELIIGKGINWSSSWPVYVLPVGNDKKMSLNDDPAASTSTIWGNTTPTATTFNQDFTGTANRTSIAYCWRSITGYSKVGSYTGNGTAGHNITTGFAAGFLMIKRTTGAGNWYMFDNKRTTGVYSDQLIANLAAAEATGTYVSINATGFALNTAASGLNDNSATFIYLAIKEN